MDMQELDIGSRAWLQLAVAIAAEVLATSALKQADGFTRLWPSLVVVPAYALAFWMLSLSLRSIPLGVAYAVWSGVGIASIALIGWAVHGQALDARALAGVGLICAGVLTISLNSTIFPR